MTQRKRRKTLSNFVKATTGRKDRKGLYLGDVSLELLEETWKQLDPEDQLKTARFAITCTMVGALWMCQLRQSVPTLSAQEVDGLQSYRAIKRGLLSGHESQLVVAVSYLAALEVAAFASYNSVEDVDRFAEILRDEFTPSAKVLEQKNSGTWRKWSLGYMARQVGIMSSAPSSNVRIFGITPEDLVGSTEIFVRKLGFFSVGFDAKQVLESTQKCVFYRNDGTQLEELVFDDDPPMKSKVEEDLRANSGVTIVRNGELKTKERTSALVKKDLSLLSTFERFAYQQAVKDGAKGIIKQLNQLLESRKVNKTAEKETPNESISLPGKEIETPETENQPLKADYSTIKEEDS